MYEHTTFPNLSGRAPLCYFREPSKTMEIQKFKGASFGMGQTKRVFNGEGPVVVDLEWHKEDAGVAKAKYRCR